MNRRGVTLLELLLAIALVLAVGALVMPALVDRLGERAFESSAEIVRSQLLLARAHAQATGEPVEVRFEPEPPRVAARWFEPDPGSLELPEDDAGGPGLQAASADLPSADEDEAPDALVIPEPWADRLLADGVRITDRPDVVDGAAEQPVASGQDETLRPIRIALYMPDGSAVLAEPVWFHDDHGRRGRLTVNRWTGLPTFEQVTRSPDELTEQQEEAPAQEEDEPQVPDVPEMEPGDSSQGEPQ